jgi:hypothetical protein
LADGLNRYMDELTIVQTEVATDGQLQDRNLLPLLPKRGARPLTAA